MRSICSPILLLFALALTKLSHQTKENENGEEFTTVQTTALDIHGRTYDDCTCNCCDNRPVLVTESCNLDLIVLVNSAACVKGYWSQMKLTIKDTIRDVVKHRVENDSNERIRIGVITYSNNAKVETELASVSNDGVDKLVDSIDDMFYEGGGDYLSLGLGKANEQFAKFENENKNTKRVVLILTNGGLSDKGEGDNISKAMRTMSLSKVDVVVSTLTEKCMKVKHCLSCCPDFHFMKTFLTVEGNICSRNSMDNCVNKFASTCAYYKLPDKPCDKKCDCSCANTKIGEHGPKGAQGLIGDRGDAGKTTEDGISGISGTPGRNGEAGNDGHDGQDGESSNTFAPHGRQGRCGDKGDKGEAGVKGFIGNHGEPGNEGAPGDSGENGLPGIQGEPGVNGQDGVTGETGIIGETGQPGLDGVRGSSGTPGASGANGKTGSKGTKGKKGIAGVNGGDGDNGAIGETGANGDKGVVGPKGTKGTDGAQGGTGARGDQGNMGLKGADAHIDYSDYKDMIDQAIMDRLANVDTKFHCW